tara:strand:- start:6 stop:386 length:381 start_codon:yes stop_codon:yes gene_type:complete
MSNQSRIAHEAIKPKKPSIESNIYAHLVIVGAATLQDIEDDLNLKNQTASARLSEMNDKGMVLIMPSGQYRVTREEEIEAVIQTRQLEKRNKWMAQGWKNKWIEQIYAQVPEGGGQTEVRMIFNEG